MNWYVLNYLIQIQSSYVSLTLKFYLAKANTPYCEGKHFSQLPIVHFAESVS